MRLGKAEEARPREGNGALTTVVMVGVGLRASAEVIRGLSSSSSVPFARPEAVKGGPSREKVEARAFRFSLFAFRFSTEVRLAAQTVRE